MRSTAPWGEHRTGEYVPLPSGRRRLQSTQGEELRGTAVEPPHGLTDTARDTRASCGACPALESR